MGVGGPLPPVEYLELAGPGFLTRAGAVDGRHGVRFRCGTVRYESDPGASRFPLWFPPRTLAARIRLVERKRCGATR